MNGSQPGSSDGKITILIAEDNAPLSELLRLFLEGEGYRVLQGRNGKEALRVAEAHEGKIHLLISDILMPEMDLSGLAERIRALRPELGLIVMSSFSPGALSLDGRWRFLLKPFAPSLLIQTVREVLAQLPGTANGAEPA